MLRARWLVLAFVVVFLATLVAGLPASLVVSQIPSVPVAGAPVLLSNATGTIWNGSVPVSWRQLRGELHWQVDFDGFTPGVRWAMDGDVPLQGWVGGTADSPTLRIEQGRVPASLIEHVSPFGAEGTLVMESVILSVSDRRLVDAGGQLRYSGGQVRWAKGEARLPPLLGTLSPQPDGALMKVQDDKGELLMEARVREQRGEIRVFRAWPALLGVSQGGDPADVVFESSQPLWQ